MLQLEALKGLYSIARNISQKISDTGYSGRNNHENRVKFHLKSQHDEKWEEEEEDYLRRS